MLDKEYEVYKKASARTNRRNRGEGQYLRKITVITIISKFVCLILRFYRSLQLVNFVFYRSLQLTERQHRKTILTAFIGSWIYSFWRTRDDFMSNSHPLRHHRSILGRGLRLGTFLLRFLRSMSGDSREWSNHFRMWSRKGRNRWFLLHVHLS